MRKFDYSFLKNGSVPADLLNALTGIYSLRSEDNGRKRRFPNIYSELEKIARVQSVRGSNAIEGIVTDDPAKAMEMSKEKNVSRGEYMQTILFNAMADII